MTCLKALCIALLLCLCQEVLGAGQPNVIVILTDDQGWGDLSHQRECVHVETPHIDQLAT